MQHKSLFNLFIILGMAMAACASINFPMALSPTPTEMLEMATAPLPSVTPQPSSTATAIFVPTQPFSTTTVAAENTATNLPLSTSTTIPTPSSPSIIPTNYIDDRSSPITLITSYFNAVNLKQYLRAYSYWSNPSTSLGTLTAFTKGYADTAAVGLVFGTVTAGAGAGQIYYPSARGHERYCHQRAEG